MAYIVPMVPFEMAVFGSTGDLAIRKLMPALFHLYQDKRLPDTTKILCLGREPMETEAYLEWVLSKNIEFSQKSREELDDFLSLITYKQVSTDKEGSFLELKQELSNKSDLVRVFYLATPPTIFGQICDALATHDLITPETRIVLEKPLGHDSASFSEINSQVLQHFEEKQIYRIDHYLGKETVQNLLALRFSNMLFEPLWNNEFISHVQITVSETVGIEGRHEFYNQSGALRDMVQNHLLQLLCLVGMEVPMSAQADVIRDEKLRVLKALRPIEGQDVLTQTVRGQYAEGRISGEKVCGYLEEGDIPPQSQTETFVALKAQIDNWRWAGVPFYLRTGKRLSKRYSEIILQFKKLPHIIFDPSAGEIFENRLIIRIQPDEGVKLRLMAKKPGPGLSLHPVYLNLNFADAFKVRYPDAYERLLMDVVRGIQTLFMRSDEVAEAWKWTGHILDGWAETGQAVRHYPAGSLGPAPSISLIERDGFTWHEEGT